MDAYVNNDSMYAGVMCNVPFADAELNKRVRDGK